MKSRFTTAEVYTILYKGNDYKLIAAINNIKNYKSVLEYLFEVFGYFYPDKAKRSSINDLVDVTISGNENEFDIIMNLKRIDYQVYMMKEMEVLPKHYTIIISSKTLDEIEAGEPNKKLRKAYERATKDLYSNTINYISIKNEIKDLEKKLKRLAIEQKKIESHLTNLNIDFHNSKNIWKEYNTKAIEIENQAESIKSEYEKNTGIIIKHH